MKADVRLYLVTGPVGRGNRLEHVVEEAIRGGVTMIQIRDKRATDGELLASARRIQAIAGPAGVPVIINDNVAVAKCAGASGVHVGTSDSAPKAARRELGVAASIGWSINDLSQIDAVDAVAASDYLAASPVWPTRSKTDTTHPFGLDGVRTLRRRMPPNLSLVAIGGIGPANAYDVIAAGADGIAVVSAICAAPDPFRSARELRAIVDEALDARGSLS